MLLLESHCVLLCPFFRRLRSVSVLTPTCSLFVFLRSSFVLSFPFLSFPSSRYIYFVIPFYFPSCLYLSLLCFDLSVSGWLSFSLSPHICRLSVCPSVVVLLCLCSTSLCPCVVCAFSREFALVASGLYCSLQQLVYSAWHIFHPRLLLMLVSC